MKKKILFFSESLDGGGAETALNNIVKYLDKDAFDITVVSETDGERFTEEIKKNSRHKSFTHKSSSPVKSSLNKVIIKGSLLLPPSAVKRLYIPGKYDIEVATCEGFSTKIIAGSQNKNSIKIAYVHTDFVNNPWSISVYKNEEEEKSCYRKFDKIVCVSETIRESFIKKYGLAEKTCVIHNITDDERIKKLGEEPADFTPKHRPLFVLVGNYLPVKGYDRLMMACARLKNDGYKFSVLIMGKAYQKEPTQKLCDELDLNDMFTLADFQTNPYKYMNSADAYICSSLAEGYSTAVTEAIISGLPVITTECSGMREIFGNLECGIICENSEDGLYFALKKVLDKPELLQKYRQNAAKRAEFFSIENSVKTINDFYKSL